MRKLTELIEGVLLLSSESLDARPEQLDGAAQVLAGLSTTLMGLSKLRAAGVDISDTVIMDSAPTPEADSGHPIFTEAEEAAAIAAQEQILKPPADSVQCTEADEQRSNPERIPKLRADGILFLEVLEHYLASLEAEVMRTVKLDDAGKPVDLEALAIATAPFMLSIECLPGTRPPVTQPNDLKHAGEIFDRVYALVKELHAKEFCDLEDRDQVLFKMTDRPAFKELTA